MEVRGPDVGVDLCAQILADSDRAEVVMYVVRNHHLAGCDETAYFFGRKSLVLGHFVHLLGDDAFARSFKLSHFGTSKPNFAVAHHGSSGSRRHSRVPDALLNFSLFPNPSSFCKFPRDNPGQSGSCAVRILSYTPLDSLTSPISRQLLERCFRGAAVKLTSTG